jgi:hypothetical protein
MNKTLGLNARPNESFKAAFQPGQANAAAGQKMTTNKKTIVSVLSISI